VEWSLTGNTYTWTLFNNSGLEGDGTPGYDVLIWSLQPFQVKEPLSWTAPDGWEWTSAGGHQQFEIANPDSKYKSPVAIAPSGSAVFTYTFDPDAPLVNSHGPQPTGIAFLTHAAAVHTEPIINHGVKEWVATSAPGLGPSWYDVSISYDPPTVVPEPSGILGLTVATAWLVTCLVRNGKRTARYRSSLAMVD
jgi:hypothetical protein